MSDTKDNVPEKPQLPVADKPDGPQLPVADKPDGLFGPSRAHIDVAQAKTDVDVLDAVLATPEDMALPWEEVTLPSLGIYYTDEKNKPLLPDGVVEVRPMNMEADKIMATSRLASSGKSLDWLYRKCVRFPNDFRPDDLLVGDRMFLLFYLRGITHGNMYDFMITCTNDDCKMGTHMDYDLNEIANTIKKPDQDLGLEPFRVSLPYLSEATNRDFWVKVRFLRGYDTLAMIGARKSKRAKPRRKRVPTLDEMSESEFIDNTISENLSMIITEAMGDKDHKKIVKLLDKMHSRDVAAIREFLREKQPGIDVTIEVACQHCGNEMKVELPITEGFFRPATTGKL